MKEIKTRFEQDETLTHIDVLVRAPERDAAVEALLGRIAEKPRNALTVTGADGAYCKLGVDDVVLVSVSGKQTHIITESTSYTLRQTLQSVESELDARKFVRVSRYELVNLEKIRKYDFTLTGTLRLELAGGMETWASRRCIPAIRRRLNERGDEA